VAAGGASPGFTSPSTPVASAARLLSVTGPEVGQRCPAAIPANPVTQPVNAALASGMRFRI